MGLSVSVPLSASMNSGQQTGSRSGLVESVSRSVLNGVSGHRHENRRLAVWIPGADINGETRHRDG